MRYKCQHSCNVQTLHYFKGDIISHKKWLALPYNLQSFFVLCDGVLVIGNIPMYTK